MKASDLQCASMEQWHAIPSLAFRWISGVLCLAALIAGKPLPAQETKERPPSNDPAARGEHAPPRSIKQARQILEKKIGTVRWIAFSPSKFNPKLQTPLLKAGMEADLRAVREAGFTGLITYSCMPKATTDAAKPEVVGFNEIPELARAAGFKGCIAGVWDPVSDIELQAAIDLATKGFVDAVCVGNEGLDERYDWKTLKSAMDAVRSRGVIPCTTTEQIEDYSLDGLRDDQAVDLMFPNIHPAFQNDKDPEKAAQWTAYMVKELRKLDGAGEGQLRVLVKETGWPSSGMEYHNVRNQQRFWLEFDRLAKKEAISYAMFESFDQPWKEEELAQGVNIGPHWGVFTADRKPKWPLVELVKAKAEK